MKKIYLVRHCDYSNPLNILVGRLPVELSEKGVAHAHRLAEYFSDKEISKIYSSAVKRCQQTSEIISQKKIPVENDQRILETFSAYQGYWGANVKGGELDWCEFFSHRAELGGESAQDMYSRMVGFFLEIVERDEGDCIICSHGDPLYLLYLHLSGKTNISDADILGELADYQTKGSIREVVWESHENLTIKSLLEI